MQQHQNRSRRSLVGVCWLIRRKARVRVLGQTVKGNIKKQNFLQRFPLNRFLEQSLHKNLSLGVDVNLQVPLLNPCLILARPVVFVSRK